MIQRDETGGVIDVGTRLVWGVNLTVWEMMRPSASPAALFNLSMDHKIIKACMAQCMKKIKKSEPTLFVFLFAWTLIHKIKLLQKKNHLQKKAAIPHMLHVWSCVHARVQHYSTDVKRNKSETGKKNNLPPAWWCIIHSNCCFDRVFSGKLISGRPK